MPGDPTATAKFEDEHAPIEVDDSIDEDNYDSGFTAQANSSTTSISSSVLDYQYENGRRYTTFRDGYKLPNDEIEQDRLDLLHHVFKLILGGRLYIAPVHNPQRVLDIGTGTGAWAIDFADENPQAEVLGNDLSPIQPAWVPSNVRFEVDDAEQPWTHKKNSFDFIHMRTLSGAFKHWHAVLRQCLDHLRPGGYLEFQDYGAELFHNTGKIPSGSSLDKWWSGTVSCGEKIGRPFIVAKYMKGWMEEAGFVDVHVHREMWPMGPWAKDRKLKERGRWGQLSHIESLEAASLLLTTVGGWTTEEVKETIAKAKQELLSKDNRFYNQTWFVYGKKPGESGVAEGD